MEKVTYKPLIDHLQQKGEYYNQRYRDHELRYGAIDPMILSHWITQILQPVVASTAKAEHEVEKIFQPMYVALLSLLGNQLAITHEQEYQRAWLMLKKNPQLSQSSGAKMVNSINSALVTIRKYQPGQMMPWLEMLEKTIPHCKTVDEFLSIGRIYAWRNGLAHLRRNAASDFSLLSPALKSIVKETSAGLLDELIANQWLSQRPVLVGKAGGFVGFGGVFKFPPKVSLIDGEIVASDDETASVLFADAFGSLLIQDTPFDAKDVFRQASTTSFKTFQSHHGKAIVPFSDITATVITNNTLVVSRESSFFLYIYGWNS